MAGKSHFWNPHTTLYKMIQILSANTTPGRSRRRCRRCLFRPFFGKHYSLGPAELLFDGQATGVKDLPIIFDSGSTFSYFSSQAYNTLVSSIKKNIDAKQLTGAVDDQSLPVCWNGSNSFKSVNDATSYFKPLTLSFMKAKNVKLHIPA